jgi:type II secretory pathway predicted ATPase ExeA
MDSTYFETFGLNRPPFEETTSAEFFIANATCNRLMHAVKQQLDCGGVSLIKGDEGCGKSILAQAMVARFKSQARILSLSVPPRSDGVAQASASRSDIGGTSRRGIEQVAGEIVDIIANATDKKCAVIVDQAHHLSADDLVSLQEHIDSASGRGLKLSVVLVGGEAIEATLRNKEFKTFAGAVKRLGELTALNAADTENYISNRLNVAGAKSNKIFARKAIRRIAEMTGGVPRKINDLAKKTMHQAAEEKQSNITASLVAKCAATTTRDERKDQPQVESMTRMNQGKIEGMVKQLQDALAGIPATVGGDAGARRDRGDVDDTLEELAESTGEADARASKLNAAIQRAEETHGQLVDFADALTRIGSSTDERIELLLTSLESAQQIHEELQHIGDQAQVLIDESRNVVAEEHDKMIAQLDELTCRREELSGVIDQFKHEQEESLRDVRREVDEKIAVIRDEMDGASAESKRFLAEAEQALKRTTRNLRDTSQLGEQVEQSLNDARHLEGTLAKTFAQIRQDVSTHRENAAAATIAHEECRQAVTEARKIAENATESAEKLVALDGQAKVRQKQLEATIENATSMAEQINKHIEESRRKVEDRHETIQDGIRQAGEGIQARLAGGIKEVARLTEDATDKINRAAYAIDEQMTDSVTAVRSTGDESVTTIKSVSEESVSTIKSVGEKTSTSIRSAREDALVALQTTGQQIEARIADSIRRYEQLVAAEEAAAKRAGEVSAHATAMMNRVSQSEAKLAETQQSILNIEALATETLASVQSRLKTMQDSVNVIVDSGASRAKTMLDESLAAFQDEALGISESLRNSATSIQDDMQLNAKEIQLIYESKKQAAQEIVEQFAVSVDELALGKITDARETVDLIATEAKTALEQQKVDVIKCVDAHAANCDVRMTELAQNRTEHIGRQIQEQGGIAITAIQETANEYTKSLKDVSLEIERKSRAALVTVEDTAITTAEQAEKRVNHAALAAAKAIQDKIASATETVTILDEAIVSGNDMVAHADERREKINQLIQEVWALTNTTDHRARSLEALATKAKTCEDNIGSLVDQAASRIVALQEQNQLADHNGATLSSQQEQVGTLSEELSKQLVVAKSLHRELNEANAAGKQIEASMASHAEEIQDLVSTADAIVKTIRDDDERAAQIGASVKHSAGIAENVEQRLSELQQSLADPISTIQNARAQADELNELCLAVKRIFRGVSQASLDANERIKMMGKMLTASHKTAETMKQWVAEAEHSRERLEAAIQATPSINDTHPPTLMPDAVDFADSMPTPVGASDLAAVTKVAKSAPIGESSPRSTDVRTVKTVQPVTTSAPKTIKFDGPEDSDPEDRFEPANSVRRANQKSVASTQRVPSGQGSVVSQEPKKRNRLSPEDVRSLIEAAKGKSSAVG